MVMEEVWNIAKQDLLVLKYYPSFADLKKRISCYFRTKRFNLNEELFVKRCLIIYAKWYMYIRICRRKTNRFDCNGYKRENRI
jgi:hypothetical protein